MPDGVMLWFDPASGDGRVVRGGREYPARASDIEPTARRAGARVHFDVRHDKGVESAVDVRLLEGTHAARHHHRFGSLVGAKYPDTKGTAPFAHPHIEFGLGLAGHPLTVVRAWARALAMGDLEQALELYSPDAVIHTEDGGDASGRGRLEAVLEVSPMLGSHREPAVQGEGPDVVRARWEQFDPDTPGIEVRSTMRHGEIVEQWFGRLPTEAGAVVIETPSGPLVLEVSIKGDVDAGAVDYARTRILHVTTLVDEPILFSRVRLTEEPDPARSRPALAQATLDVNGRLVRAHVAAREMREAIDLLERRLRDKLEHLTEHRQALGRHLQQRQEPGEWRHGYLPTQRPEYFDRPVEERAIVRHKAFAVSEATPDEAAFDMDLLDYDFHLFRDLASGDDALLQRAEDGTYRLHHAHGGVAAAVPIEYAYPIRTDATPAPELSVAEATERLDAGDEPFVFFTNVATGRGNALYRRYDGHYGLITLEEAPVGAATAS